MSNSPSSSTRLLATGCAKRRATHSCSFHFLIRVVGKSFAFRDDKVLVGLARLARLAGLRRAQESLDLLLNFLFRRPLGGLLSFFRPRLFCPRRGACLAAPSTGGGTGCLLAFSLGWCAAGTGRLGLLRLVELLWLPGLARHARLCLCLLRLVRLVRLVAAALVA